MSIHYRPWHTEMTWLGASALGLLASNVVPVQQHVVALLSIKGETATATLQDNACTRDFAPCCRWN